MKKLTCPVWRNLFWFLFICLLFWSEQAVAAASYSCRKSISVPVSYITSDTDQIADPDLPDNALSASQYRSSLASDQSSHDKIKKLLRNGVDTYTGVLLSAPAQGKQHSGIVKRVDNSRLYLLYCIFRI
jgi:hypothetical protein